MAGGGRGGGVTVTCESDSSQFASFETSYLVNNLAVSLHKMDLDTYFTDLHKNKQKYLCTNSRQEQTNITTCTRDLNDN